ncbi:FkbM family methyltransferase [Methylobacterium oryzihabitans]|uniref:FkbM family methyltransferase n=1 Tax=Methylobacterium oryzihabitans TaxID=2499852 RepID=A0A3S2YTX5_9HYPH|nr:FkbM family methyltransferase [Methylobacterium oryzihabitans]RVU19144.1 FkbM family methyltransferase [Methylobacterium oryzihabitans]
MPLLDFIDTMNGRTLAEVPGFRRAAARDVPDTYDRRFFEHRFHHPFFGYVEVQNDGCQPFYMFTNNDDAVAQQYLWYGKNGYAPASVREWVRLARTARAVFDVGAHTGLFSLLACGANPDLAEVVAFEPLPRAHARIVENLIVNGLVPRVAAERVAVADRTGERILHVPGDEYQIVLTASTLSQGDAEMMHRRERCDTISLDDYVERTGLEPDLVKLRMEGTEPEGLAGAAGLLARRRTSFLVEARPEHRAVLLDRLAGYAITLIDDAANRILRPGEPGAEAARTILAVPPAG